jgi:DNA-binding PadR family transcriptional regulator
VRATAKRRKLSNPLALAVMVFLAERAMHPYEIARLLRQRGKEHSIKINYGSLYTVVQNLEKHGFVAVAGVQRQGNRPERTLYGLTDAGRAEMHDWLADLLAVPAKEYPAFEAALSLMPVLHPDEVTDLLTERADALEVRAAGLRGVLGRLDDDLPRIFLIETEYELHMIEAEAAWVRALAGELADGTITGAPEWRSWHDTGVVPGRWRQWEEHGEPDGQDSRPGPEGPGDPGSREGADSPEEAREPTTD